MDLKAVYLIVQWIFFSSTIIIFNKYLLDTAGFHFPLTLVLMHMVFITGCAQLWKRMGWVDVPVLSWYEIGVRFVPVAICFASSLGLGNAAYLYISVAFIQMIKASTPVAVMLVSFALGIEEPNCAPPPTTVRPPNGGLVRTVALDACRAPHHHPPSGPGSAMPASRL